MQEDGSKVKGSKIQKIEKKQEKGGSLKKGGINTEEWIK